MIDHMHQEVVDINCQSQDRQSELMETIMVTTDADHEEVKNITLPRNVRVQEVEEMITGEMICMSRGEEVMVVMMSITGMRMRLWEEETLGLLDNHEFLTTHMHLAVMEIEK